ncbi:hypothetical protein AB835_13740 [Candidatus Endobugula sertula]|uniref:Uncharacterized protein n=1 Tax=Candidatus Endobugula sertula TaxID=62101 RepID=A0A1D2QLS9_9GAMM|nr:hypothetical protein AB835_13740 [Candidatus Endobugula sertula]
MLITWGLLEVPVTILNVLLLIKHIDITLKISTAGLWILLSFYRQSIKTVKCSILNIMSLKKFNKKYKSIQDRLRQQLKNSSWNLSEITMKINDQFQ